MKEQYITHVINKKNKPEALVKKERTEMLEKGYYPFNMFSDYNFVDDEYFLEIVGEKKTNDEIIKIINDTIKAFKIIK